ncbi:hypothetical protein HKX48_007775 [Thoreauomyces humboldtii]|nr:hypothetical protein HKX48_007775 [Thoreauomyces humboldtii]
MAFVELFFTPINCALLIILVVLVSAVRTPVHAQVPPAQHPPAPIILRNFTMKELLAFDGRDSSPIYMAVMGRVYDVSRGRDFYGPGGPYENFAGRDASRGLSKQSFDEDMLSDPTGPIDALVDIDKDERQALREWAQHFETK